MSVCFADDVPIECVARQIFYLVWGGQKQKINPPAMSLLLSNLYSVFW